MNQPMHYQQQQYFVYTNVSKEDAERWPIGPNSLLIFLNQNEGEIFIKSLQYQPGARPEFVVYTSKAEEKEESTVEIELAPLKSDISFLMKEVEKIKNRMNNKQSKGEVNHG